MLTGKAADLVLEPIEQKTMTELVAQRLVNLLSVGVLKPGDKLPAERDLAHQLNVSRTTVREALKLLTLSGLLEARRGDGTYVCQDFTSFLSHQIEWPVLLSASEVDMIVEVREGLEAKAARLAAERATRQDIGRLAVFRQMQEMEVTDVERVTDLDLEFHDAVACASHNELLCRVMSSLQNILRQYIALSNQMTHEPETTIAEHQAIYAAIASGDPDAAEQAMMDHLAISKSWILKAVARKSQALKVG